MSNEPRPPTLEDVAREAGVSRATVSRVINGVRNVDPQLHEIVWQAVNVTGYVPNRAARSLVTKRAGTIGLVVSDSEDHSQDDPFMARFFTDPFFGRVVGGMLSVLRPHGNHLVLMFAGSHDTQSQLVSDLRQGYADGVVVLSLGVDDALPRLLADAGIPSVLVGRPLEPVPISYVDVANDDGAVLAAEQLVARGCREIGMITGPAAVPATIDRLAGFRRAMARHGRPYVPMVEGNFTLESGEQAMRKLLAEHPELDGVFIFNDLMAQGALVALQDAGRSVPDDVAIVGFDDSNPAVAARPQLTTVRQPLEDMAAEAVRMLLARLDDPRMRVASSIFEPSLVHRHSA